MISIRHSSAGRQNRELKSLPAKRRETNSRWLARTRIENGVLLLGGNALAHFRLRVAQSHLRKDLLPSFWSMAAILDGGRRLWTVPLEGMGDASLVPVNNGVQACRIGDYDDPERYPNIAVVQFAQDTPAIRRNVEEVRSQRAMIDLPDLLVRWLGFVWGAAQQGNPLLDGRGIPSAAFAETVYSIARIDLTPGLSSASSCPEAIWQSAKWWRQYYEQTTGAADPHGVALTPKGFYALRQPAAAAVEHRR